MNIIAVESSTRICSVSSFIENSLINVVETNEPMSHSKNLPLMLKAAIQDFESIKAIDAFAISIGPGSFTSLRISMSLIKGLAFGLKANMLPVPTLDSINYQVKNSEPRYILLDCYKDKCFVQKFKGKKPDSEPYIESIENLSGITSPFYGYSDKIDDSILKINKIMPSSILIGQFALDNIDRLLKKYDSNIKPIYLSENEYVKINDSKSKK